MCRPLDGNNKHNEKRRCDCDTSEARRLRRHNRDSIQRNAPLALQPATPNYIALLTHPEEKEEGVTFTTEEVKAEVQSMTAGIRELLKNGESDDAILIFVDRKLNTIGAGVDYLSENKYGAPTDAEFIEAYDSFKKPFLQYLAEAVKAGKDAEAAGEEASDRIHSDWHGAMSQLFEKRNAAIRQSLVDVGVQFADPETLRYTDNSNEEAVKALKKSISFYPQSWIDASNEMKSPLYVKTMKEDQRAGYKPNGSILNILKRRSEITVMEARANDFRGGISIGMHEFAHRVEHAIPAVVGMERTFLMRRAGHSSEAGNSAKPEELSHIVLEEESHSKRKQVSEVGYKDNFPTHYMGKVYDSGQAYEILSMGMESLFTGKNGGLAGIEKHKADPDYKRFILGILASSAT